jgi:hypothetical protein
MPIFIIMIKLLDLLKEYDNQGPSIPESYLIENRKIKKIPFSDISKIPNLEYDMGGGETSLYEEYNIVVIDNIPVKEFAKDPGGDKKIYIEYNLENPYSFPKANKIHLSQVVYHINNIEALAKTVNDSLKSNGVLDFFSDIMSKEDKQFINILVENYDFFLPDNTSLKSLSRYKEKNLLLRRGVPYITPKKEKFTPKEWIYDVVAKEGNARVKYTTDEYNYIDTEKISGTIPDRYFVMDRNSRMKGVEPDYIGMRFSLKDWNPEKGPYPYYQIPNGNYWEETPWKIMSFKRVQ